MKVYGKRVCDVCGQSAMVEINDHKYEVAGELKSDWAYGSREDGTCYHLDLCENCFSVAVAALKDHRRSLGVLDKDREFLDEDFGIDKSLTMNVHDSKRKPGRYKSQVVIPDYFNDEGSEIFKEEDR